VSSNILLVIFAIGRLKCIGEFLRYFNAATGLTATYSAVQTHIYRFLLQMKIA